jgi:hypothetical protein
VISKHLSRRLARLEDSVLPAKEEPNRRRGYGCLLGRAAQWPIPSDVRRPAETEHVPGQAAPPTQTNRPCRLRAPSP